MTNKDLVLELDDFTIARVTSEHKGAYRVKDEKGEYLAKITGKQMFEASGRKDYPAVGDFVKITKPDDDSTVIHKILPRKNLIQRRRGDDVQIIATNIDVAFVVESVGRDYNLNRFERYFSIAKDGGIQPVIILNKIDLISEKELEEKLNQLRNRFLGIDIILTSTINNNGLDQLKNYMNEDKTYCFLGSSVVGKSSLINELIGHPSTGEPIKTEKISSYSDRGKHVTTTRQMYFLPHGIVIDNPGMREVGMADVSGGIDDLFGEITNLSQKCKYADCTHTNEPGCAVIKAVESGKLNKEKYSNYLNLKKESEYYEMNDIERKEKDRRFGKFLKKAKKDLKDFGHKDY